ncbi:MAG: helix-turn-helix transcriptional regulator [Candidatus Gracilibacteria bacterium]|jgi:ribosome-binding protein aMBF1 (putative translation factor)
MKSYSQFKKKALKDPAVKKAYLEFKGEFEIAKSVIERRLEKGLTQGQLAKKIGTKQSAISRLESGTYNPSVEFLTKVAKALGAKLVVRFD